MKFEIRIDNADRNIVMGKVFAKRAAIYGSQEYGMLQDCRRDYPEFTVITRSIKKNPGKESYKGLTYQFMEEYIASHENADVNMAEYLELRIKVKCHSIKYPHVKKWFLETYPDVDRFEINNDKTASLQMQKHEGVELMSA